MGRSGARRRRRIGGMLAALALVLLGPVEGRAQAAREYQLKAVFLFNFTQFVEWPPAALPAAESPLIIGVLGEDPFGAALDEVVRGEKVGTHPLAVRRYRRVEEIDTCHILFVSRSEESRLEQIFARLKGRNVLTVGDTVGFASRGGMIRFVTESNKVRMRINPEAARESGLTISSKLLRPAEIIRTGKG